MKDKMKPKEYFTIFLKGILMGICDLIPGISGGTIAFITGIYERLINAVKNFNLSLLKSLIFSITGKGKNGELKENIKRLDLFFLVTLGLGIGLSLLLGSRIIKWLLENNTAYTLAFFIGLIIASSKIIFDNIKNHKIKNISFGVIGLVIGILLSVIIPVDITPTLSYIFLGGFLGISAMFLPGISGAFILLILGLYEYMLGVLHDITYNLGPLVAFLLGAVLGAITISRVISYLFKKDRCKTLYALLGLVLGALSIPLREVYINVQNGYQVFISIGFLILGIIIVTIINSQNKR